jgi:HTH-type transcriptional regulator / antitoxin HigA
MTLTFNQNQYVDLLARYQPKVIVTEVEYKQALTVAEHFVFKKKRTLEELALYELVVMLIENYETKHYPMHEWENHSPHEMLQYLLETSGKKQADLIGIIGSSGVVSEVVTGKRSISKAQAKKLGETFKVSPSLFI